MVGSLVRLLSHLPGTELLPGRMKALIRAFGNHPVYPTMLNIEPTRRCNLHCVMCCLVQLPCEARPDMSLDMFKRIVSRFPKSLEWVTIQGLGEPLLNKSLLEMVEFCRGLDLKTRFNTNLTVMNERIAERLVRCGHTEVQVSLETTDPVLYADIRRGAQLDRVMRNLELLVNMKKRLGSNLPEITVHAILMKAILPTIPAMVATLKTAGVDHLLFSDLGVLGDARLQDGTTMAENSLTATMAEHEISTILSEVKRLETPDFQISVPGEWLGLRAGVKPDTGIMTCKELWEAPYVTCDGYATPCCAIPDPSACDLGNYNDQTFEEVWFGEPYQRLRLSHVQNRHPGVCRKCARLVCTFAAPSSLKPHATIQQHYAKCFTGRRAFTERTLGMKLKPDSQASPPVPQETQTKGPS